jgi:FKBP12-rapamycin complex-associated protein
LGLLVFSEQNFADAYANDLQEAHDNLKAYVESVRASGRQVPTGRAAPGAKSRKRLVTNEEDQLLQRAWHLYYLVFKRINKQLPHHMTLELEYVSPALQAARDLDLAVPGTYRVSGQAVRIRSFGEVVHVISSKQRPRKLTMCGEDGESYMFLLKGHEDLRQDERAMQLFGLVNALLERDRVTANYDLSIRRYAVVPLSPNTGLVGWVPQCDTLHTLIRDYRDKRNVVLNIEHRLMSQMYQDYDSLTLMQKVCCQLAVCCCGWVSFCLRLTCSVAHSL